MIRYACPHCEDQLEAPSELAGEEFRCPQCGNPTIVPRRFAQQAGRAVPQQHWAPNSITVPLLISAIGNIVVGLVWTVTCYGVVFAIPMFILSAFEFAHYARAGNVPAVQFARTSTTLGIWEVIVGLANTISLVCGILVLIHSSKLSSRC